MFLTASISFLLGAITVGSIIYVIFVNKINKVKECSAVLKAKLESTESIQDVIKRDFVQLANEAIKREQEDLRKQNREVLEEKIYPLTKELGEFKQKVESFNLKGVENTTKIIEQIANLEKNNKTIEQEARNLTQALTKNQNVKGAYGEDLLDSILNSCGMEEGIHYNKQFVSSASNLKDNETHTIRPDVVINLPNNRHLIIDSKVTLTSYLEYIQDESKLKDFKSEVKKRITELSAKNYCNAQDISQPDFVLMYMPIESSVSLIYQDSELINLAYKSNIIIVGTASLLTTVRLVNQLMAQERQVENVGKIVKAGAALYDTFVQFCEDLIDVQKKFDTVSSQLNKTINRFSRGNKNKPSLFSQVNALKEYGITSSGEIPGDFLTEEENDTLMIEQKENELDGVLAND